MKNKFVLTIAAFVLALVAYGDSGSGDNLNDFVEACISSTNLERPLCECVAKKANKELSPGGFAFLVASLKGDEAKAKALRSKLDMSEMTVAGMFMTKAPARCAKEMEGNR